MKASGLFFVALTIATSFSLMNRRSNTSQATSTVQCGKAGEYCVNRATSSGWCKVQEATEAQMYGPTLVGGLKSREEAKAEMCKKYDFGNPDTDKCSDVLPKGACDKGVRKK